MGVALSTKVLATVTMLIVLGNVAAAAPPPRPPPRPPSATPPLQLLNLTSFYELWRSRNAALPRANITFIDSRPQALFQISHVPGARSVPSTTATKVAALASKQGGVDPAKDVACYCTVSTTALSTCQEFAKVKAYAKSKFYVLDSGFTAWVAAGYPTKAGKA